MIRISILRLKLRLSHTRTDKRTAINDKNLNSEIETSQQAEETKERLGTINDKNLNSEIETENKES